MATCDHCGEVLSDEQGNSYQIIIDGKSHRFCSYEHLSKSQKAQNLTHPSLSQLVLNKAFLEVMAVITGLGGVYYTLFPIESRALLMDTLSVVTGITALVVGIEHLRYVEEHELLGRAILFAAIIALMTLIILVFIVGFH
jgi:hypothetical protein